MNSKQLTIMGQGKGFIAALDQSGGSTPKALAAYGIPKDAYADDKEMFDLVHEMRTRIMTSPAFFSDHILGTILFEQTMDREIGGMLSGDFLWETKGIIPFVKVDKGLLDPSDGVRLMKDMPALDELLTRAVKRKMFGTKMRSFIQEGNPDGIRKNVEQQFDVGKRILKYDLMPILEPEIDIKSPSKARAEQLLKAEILKNLDKLPDGSQIMLKLTLPDVDDFYAEVIAHPKVLRVVALSGGYSREQAVDLLARNHGMTASFSRALTEGLSVDQTDDMFNDILAQSIENIYQAAIT